MKKLLAMLAFAIISLNIVSCGSDKNETPETADSTAQELFEEKVEEQKLELSNLPKVVQETIEYQYTDAKITDIKMINNSIDTTYQIVLDYNNETLNLNITSSGKILIK